MDQGSTRKRSAVHNFAPTVTKFCVMWEGQTLPHDTKFGNSRCEIVGRRVIFIRSLIHGLSWSGLIKAEPGCLSTRAHGTHSGDNLGMDLTHWGQVMHICISRLDHHWFRQWLVAWSAPSHYLHQCWNNIDRRVLQMRLLLAACQKLAGEYNRRLNVLYVFEHKTYIF